MGGGMDRNSPNVDHQDESYVKDFAPLQSSKNGTYIRTKFYE